MPRSNPPIRFGDTRTPWHLCSRQGKCTYPQVQVLLRGVYTERSRVACARNDKCEF